MGVSESITIGGYPLSGEFQSANYKVTRLHGWWDRPAVKRHTLTREMADGDFLSPWNFEARHISIDGWVKVRSHEQAHHIMDQLNGLAVLRREWLNVQGHGITQSALVEADSGTLVEPVAGTKVRFELRFKANDPRKYGQLRTADVTSNWNSIRQYGNYPAIPEVRIWGHEIGDDGFTVAAEMPDGDVRVWWYNSWTNNALHIIEYATGRHIVAGNEAMSRIRRAETWTIPPHQPVAVRAIPRLGAGGYLDRGTVTWRDTWI